MKVEMRFVKKTAILEPSGDFVAIELRGSPILVENLKQLIVDFMKKTEGLEEHY